jgi:phage terminase large subunit
MGGVVRIPYRPRPLQKVIHGGMNTHRWGAVVCHRRFGKTVCAVNHLQRGAMTCSKERPRFAYLAPTYKQAKAVAWDYVKHFSAPVIDHGVNESELRVDFGQNSSQVRLFGADNPDSLRGLYFDGVVLDEYGLMPPKIFSEVIRPLLSDRLGWALFLGTPNGKNQFYDVIQTARNSDDWFFAEYKASETGLIPESELKSARATMTQDEYDQEYECSFEASVKGAVFARELVNARQDGRITTVPYDPQLPVDTAWDLGVGDATAIWFSQSSPSGEVRLIDYYEASGEGLQHYAKVLSQKPYVYGQHVGPHDIEVRELGTGHSRLELARGLGLNFIVCPRLSLEDGIAAVRALIPRCWFDSTRAQPGVEALQHYRWDYNTRINEFKPTPVHDWASHGADAFRTLAVRHFTPRVRKQQQKDVDPYDLRVRQMQRRPMRGGY